MTNTTVPSEREALADLIPKTATIVYTDGEPVGVTMTYAEILQFAAALAPPATVEPVEARSYQGLVAQLRSYGTTSQNRKAEENTLHVVATLLESLAAPQQPAQPAGVRMLTDSELGDLADHKRWIDDGDLTWLCQAVQTKFAEVNNLTVKP